MNRRVVATLVRFGAFGPLPHLFARRMRASSPGDIGSRLLYPEDAALPETEQWYVGMGGLGVRNVTRPTLVPVLAAPERATGAAMIVLPGGGFESLAFESEGLAVAEFLAGHGVSAFVLKYRLRPTPRHDAAFTRHTLRSLAGYVSSEPTVYSLTSAGAVPDALTALRLVREGADEYGVDPSRVGMVGFSAGAMTTLRTVLDSPTPAERPAFVGYIYGPMGPVDVPDEAPPMFVTIAHDDGIFAVPESGLIENWREAGRPVTFHTYASGGHGYGLGSARNESRAMRDDLTEWLVGEGLGRMPVRVR